MTPWIIWAICLIVKCVGGGIIGWHTRSVKLAVLGVALLEATHIVESMVKV
jgi:hypothetical protein